MAIRNRFSRRAGEPATDAVQRLTTELSAIPAKIDAAEMAADVDELARLLAIDRVLRRQIVDAERAANHERIARELAEAKSQSAEARARRAEAELRADEFDLAAAVFTWAGIRERSMAGSLAHVIAGLSDRTTYLETEATNND